MMRSDPRLPQGPRPLKSRAVQYLDLDAIYAAVQAVQGGIVKKIASRTGRMESTFYHQQEREKGDQDPWRRPWLLFQIVKQQTALETKPREEACAELICEADHLGADVVWRERPSGDRRDVIVRVAAVLAEAAAIVTGTHSALADNVLTPAELQEAKRQLRALRAAADRLECDLEQMAVMGATEEEFERLYGAGSPAGEEP